VTRLHQTRQSDIAYRYRLNIIGATKKFTVDLGTMKMQEKPMANEDAGHDITRKDIVLSCIFIPRNFLSAIGFSCIFSRSVDLHAKHADRPTKNT